MRATQLQELPPQRGDRAVDRTEGLLMRRIGQLQIHKQVAAAPGSENETIRKQLKHRLRSGCGHEQAPAVTANLSEPLVLNNVAKETREALERHWNARAKQRTDGWHVWLADQKEAGGRGIFAWLRRGEASWGPSPLSKQQAQAIG